MDGSVEKALAIRFAIAIITVPAAYMFFAWLFIFRSGYLIDKLKLTDGFESDVILVETSRKTILSISVIVIGGLILADSIPSFIKLIYSNYLISEESRGQIKFDATNYGLQGAKIIIGLLLLGEQRRIVDLIERKSAVKESE